jgi:hypothetical protein
MLSFVEYLSQFANQNNSIIFKMIDGETQVLFGPWEIGNDFVAGRTRSDESGDLCALRFDGIVKISPGPSSDS